MLKRYLVYLYLLAIDEPRIWHELIKRRLVRLPNAATGPTGGNLANTVEANAPTLHREDESREANIAAEMTTHECIYIYMCTYIEVERRRLGRTAFSKTSRPLGRSRAKAKDGSGSHSELLSRMDGIGLLPLLMHRGVEERAEALDNA